MYGISCAELEMMYKREALAEERKKHVVRARFAYSAEAQPLPFAIEIGDKSGSGWISDSDVIHKGRQTTCGDLIMGQSEQVYIIVAVSGRLREIRPASTSFSCHRMYFDFWDSNMTFVAIRQLYIEGSENAKGNSI